MGNQQQPVVLSIAGFDPCSGAGVTADIKTLGAHGCYAVTCITALTVQSTTGVRSVQPVAAKLVEQTLEELARDFEIAAVRIGMLGSSEVVQAIAAFLKKQSPPNIVLDPIFKSSSGAPLLEKGGIDLVRRQLLPLAAVITPNVDEAAELTGMRVTTIAEMKAAALRLHEMGARHVVITGGDITPGQPPEKATDLLSVMGANGQAEQTPFASDRVRSNSTHGTGCAFASALAANLALGKQLSDAVVMSKAYVKKAIASARPLGKGQGPLHHLYRLEEVPRAPSDSLAAKEH